MKTKIIELRQKRAKLIADARALLEKAENAKQDLTSEEQNNWDQMMNEADKLRIEAERLERLMDAEAELGTADRGTRADSGREDSSHRGAPGQNIEFQSRGLRGLNGVNAGWREQREWRNLLRTTSAEYGRDLRMYLREGVTSPEFRALQADLNTAGGYFLPLQIVDQILKTVDDAVQIRQLATVFSVPNADSLGAVILENDPSDAEWVTELSTGTDDTTMSFGFRELQPHPVAKRLRISRKLLMKMPSVEDLVVQRLSYKLSVTTEKAYMTGSGAGQPLGLFVASDSGIPTSRDYATDATTTAPTMDQLIGAKYNIKQQYWSRLRWVAHRSFYEKVAKFKDGDGQYLWQPSVVASSPDRLLGVPVVVSEWAPSTFTTGQYVALLGDLSQFWIAESMQMEIMRLQELYAETAQIGMILRADIDAAPVSPGGEAFTRVTLA